MATSKIQKTNSTELLREDVQIATGLTIAANSVLSATQSKDASKSGYTALGIVSTKSNNNSINFLRCEITTSGVIYARVSNPTSAQISDVSITATVLYMKN